MFTPASILGMLFRPLLSILFLATGIYLLTMWYNHRERQVIERIEVPALQEVVEGDRPQELRQPPAQELRQPPETIERVRTVSWEFGLNRETAFLLGGLALVSWSIGGGWVFSPRLLRRIGRDEPGKLQGQVQQVRMPDGTQLHVESFGREDAPPIVCVHGWGLDHQAWYYFIKRFSADYRIITWDLPGLGQSDQPADRNWSLERLAQSLHAVIGVAGKKPVVLVGHSIGVMTILTYCKLFPASLGTRVIGLVLGQSTYTNPVKTTSGAAIYTALQKPVLEPLCHLMVWLSPLYRVANWMSYWNGSAHRSTEKESFSGKETRGQLDFFTSYYLPAPPHVIARGMLGMFRYDATDVLARIPIATLVVAGDKDRTCLPEASEFMAKTIPLAELVELKSAKHCGLFEHHFEFHQTVEAFLRKNETHQTSAIHFDPKKSTIPVPR